MINTSLASSNRDGRRKFLKMKSDNNSPICYNVPDDSRHILNGGLQKIGGVFCYDSGQTGSNQDAGKSARR